MLRTLMSRAYKAWGSIWRTDRTVRFWLEVSAVRSYGQEDG